MDTLFQIAANQGRVAPQRCRSGSVQAGVSDAVLPLRCVAVQQRRQCWGQIRRSRRGHQLALHRGIVLRTHRQTDVAAKQQGHLPRHCLGDIAAVFDGVIGQTATRIHAAIPAKRPGGTRRHAAHALRTARFTSRCFCGWGRWHIGANQLAEQHTGTDTRHHQRAIFSQRAKAAAQRPRTLGHGRRVDTNAKARLGKNAPHAQGELGQFVLNRCVVVATARVGRHQCPEAISVTPLAHRQCDRDNGRRPRQHPLVPRMPPHLVPAFQIAHLRVPPLLSPSVKARHHRRLKRCDRRNAHGTKPQRRRRIGQKRPLRRSVSRQITQVM